MKLAVISHTPHYLKDGKITAWGPTVRELNFLTKIFDEINHIAPLHKDSSPGSSLSYKSDKIKFTALLPYGGAGFSDKISILTTAYHNYKIIHSGIQNSDWIQFRAPTAMGLYVLPMLSLKRNSNLWVKYAGNWQMKNPPLSYRFQKWWLENNYQKSFVTINGLWENQKKHILNFQNPCLDESELFKARIAASKKDFTGKLTLGFAGTLTKNKGVDLILKAVEKINRPESFIEIVFAGDGAERDRYEKVASGLKIKITFSGFLGREGMEKFYERTDIIILPSESEGFPKVIAEAAAYGCVPVVSDISSIGQYFNHTNGFLLKHITADEIADKLNEAESDRKALKMKSIESLKVAELFTFEKYIEELKNRILDKGNIKF